MERGFSAQIVGHAFQPLKEIQAPQPEAADHGDDYNGHNDGRMFGRFKCHPAELNKKTEQLKAALVLKSLYLSFIKGYQQRIHLHHRHHHHHRLRRR